MKRLVIAIIIWLLYSISGRVIVSLGYNNFLHGYLSWNLLLSLVALVFSLLVKGKSKLNLFLLVGWFFMLPNSFYMITDLIHINSRWFYRVNPTVKYIMDGLPWLRLVHLFVGVFLSVYWGLLSMSHVYRWLRQKMSWYWVEFIFIIIALLNGVGIFLGRFIRLNSWDMFKPRMVIDILFDTVDGFSIKFIVLFGAMIYGLFQFYMWHNRFIVKECLDEYQSKTDQESQE